jgi:hypothetical protein
VSEDQTSYALESTYHARVTEVLAPITAPL